MARSHPVLTAAGVLLAGLLSAATLLAGGWGVLTIRHLPDYVIAGEPFDLTFALRGHGRALSSGLHATVRAVRGSARVHAEATPAVEPGYYTATIVLPEPGEWRVDIQTSYGDRQLVTLPVQAIARGSTPPALSAEARGARLFAAKGCMTCHRHEAVDSNHPAPVGPPLAGKQYTREFLEWRLTHASAAGPPAAPVWTMPDLELTKSEIAALVAFLAPARRATARPRERWRAVFLDPMEKRPKMVSEMLFELEIEGTRVTGLAHMAYWPGTAPIADGRIDSDHIAFTVIGTLPWCASSAQLSGCGYPHLTFTGRRIDRQMILALDWGSLVDGEYVSAAEWPAAGLGELTMLATRVRD